MTQEMIDIEQMTEEENARLVQEYLDKGGVVTQCEYGKTTERADGKSGWNEWGKGLSQPNGGKPHPEGLEALMNDGKTNKE